MNETQQQHNRIPDVGNSVAPMINMIATVCKCDVGEGNDNSVDKTVCGGESYVWAALA